MKVSIIGSGQIGTQWSLLYASAGFTVSLYDAEPSRATVACDAAKRQLLRLEACGQLRGSLSAEQQASLITPSSTLESALANTRLVQECVFEAREVKRAVFEQLDRLAPDSAVLCSSSSCIAVSEFASELSCRSRCLVAHPVNPPYLTRLVELVPASFTSPQAVEFVRETLLKVGQEPVVLRKEMDGFAVNRLQYAVINEAWRLVTSGAMSAEDVDKVMTHGLAPRYCSLGPLAVMQTNAAGIRDYCQRYSEGIRRVSSTYGPTPAYTSEEVEIVAAQVDAYLPIDELEMARRRRDELLVRLEEVKRSLAGMENE